MRAQFRAAALALCVALPATAATQSVETLRSGTAHEALFAIARDGERAVAVGAAGDILESRDGGASWSHAETPTTLALLGIALQGERAVAVGQQGTVLLRDAGGKWSAADSGSIERLFAVDLNARGAAVTTGAFGAVLKSDDGGLSWRAIAPDWSTFTDDGAEPHLYAAHIDDEGTITVAGEFGLILRTRDDGKNWRRLHRGEASIFALELRTDAVSHAVGQVGTVLRSEDGGERWSAVDSGSTVNLLAVSGTRDGTVVAAGFRETLISRDHGRTWRTLAAEPFSGLWFADVTTSTTDGALLAVGQAGLVVKLKP